MGPTLHRSVHASLVAEHELQTRRLNSCGSRAQLLRDMWDLPRPGLEPVSPALAGRFSTTAPPGKPRSVAFSDVRFGAHAAVDGACSPPGPTEPPSVCAPTSPPLQASCLRPAPGLLLRSAPGSQSQLGPEN